MKPMNEKANVLVMRKFMDRSDGWGRSNGRDVYQRLLQAVEQHPGIVVFKLSMKGVQRIDISFASETIVELARRYRGTKGFCVADLEDPDVIENLDAAAAKKNQPITMAGEKELRVIGAVPSQGCKEALDFTLARPQARASEFATAKDMPIANASMKFKQLWEQGFLLRTESAAETGGVEFVYKRIL